MQRTFSAFRRLNNALVLETKKSLFCHLIEKDEVYRGQLVFWIFHEVCNINMFHVIFIVRTYEHIKTNSHVYSSPN